MMLLSRVNGAFWLLWLVLLFISYLYSYDDPSSIFYNPHRAYRQRFSRVRATEATAFLQNPLPKADVAKAHERLLCIGVPSVNRTSRSFLPYTIATLTDTLTPEERATIHLVVLLANRPSENHFAYGQAWLEGIADEVLIYDQAENPAYRTIPFDLYNGQARGDERVENMRLDHSALVETCRKHGSSYFALVEDDIIASRDWFQKFKLGMDSLEKKGTKSNKDWIYLRLFYSEIFMGWNKEEWPLYLKNIFLVYAAAFSILLFGRRCFNATQRHTILMALVLGVWMPAAIGLYFAAGRLSVSRLNLFPSKVREMPRYGCCAQGMVFPRRHLEALQNLFRDPPYDFPGDMILEGFSDSHGLAKWALIPSVFQHVGLSESSGGAQRAEVWNFGFERQHGGPEA